MPLVIRKEQMAALQLHSDIGWYDGELTELYPDFGAVTGDQRRQWVRASLQRATAFGLNRPEQFQYLCFERTFPPDSIKNPDFEWARRILKEPGKTSAERMKHLRHETVRRLLEIEAQEEKAAQAPEEEEIESAPEP